MARYKLGALEIDTGDALAGKAALQEALKQNPSLKDADYYLGRAEMGLDNNEAAVEDLKRATSGNTDPEIVQQAWYQLGILYRRLHRLEDAKNAMAMFQKLKDAEADNSQRVLERYRAQQNSKPAAPPPTPQDPQ